MKTNELIIEWYLKGFNDELKGGTTLMDCSRLLETAYILGASNAADPNFGKVPLEEEDIIAKIKKI